MLHISTCSVLSLYLICVHHILFSCLPTETPSIAAVTLIHMHAAISRKMPSLMCHWNCKGYWMVDGCVKYEITIVSLHAISINRKTRERQFFVSICSFCVFFLVCASNLLKLVSYIQCVKIIRLCLFALKSIQCYKMCAHFHYID